MRPRAVRRAAPALALGAAAAALLLAPSLVVPGHRGAARIAFGFVPGRWDARFIVARGPAALRLPPEPLRVALRISGPAALTVRTAAGERRLSLGAEPSPVEVVLPQGGRAELASDATLRLHEVRLRRLGPPPWGAAVLLGVATLAAAAFAFFRSGAWAVPASLAVTAIAAAAILRGRLGGVALAAGLDRLPPAGAVLTVGSLFLLPWLLPPRPGAGSRPDPRLPAAFGLLALASCLSQVLFLPQPLLIGDPAAYDDIGRRFAAALGQLRSPGDVGDAVQTLRPYGGLAATGLLYGALIGLRGEVSTIYVAHALAMAGAVAFLVRAAARIGGRRLAIIAGVLALLYPTFPVICGIVQPEPVILLLWTFALDLVLRAREERSLRRFAIAGLCFALGLALHPQGLWFLLAALALVAIPFARGLLRAPVRPWAAAFALGLLPVVLSTAAGEAYARPAAHVLDERHGFWAYTARVPLGFWLFLDTGGWQGPLRVDDTRYARGLLAAEEKGAIHGAAGRAAYTARFVAENLAASLRTVLRNLHRLFHVPDNPFHRDWILPYAPQVRWHRALVVLFLLAFPLALARRAAPLLVPFLILAATYPLYHVFNKYAVPATPFVLLGAALALDRLAFAEARVGLFALALGIAALGADLHPADIVFQGLSVRAARALPAALHWGGLGLAFLLAGKRWAQDAAGRAAAAAAAALFLAPAVAAAWGDPSWRGFSVTLERGAHHEIAPGADGLERLAASRQAWLLLDLLLPDGRGDGVRLAFDGGLVVEGRDLQPTMPAFGLATLRGGRDPRTFRQWWAAPFDPAMARDGRVGLTVAAASESARIFGDVGAPRSDGIDHGLSLGQWPYLSVYRLMHDGEYRLPARQPLSGSRRSRLAGRVVPGALRIRLVILDETAGPPPWGAGPPSPRPWRPLAVY